MSETRSESHHNPVCAFQSDLYPAFSPLAYTFSQSFFIEHKSGPKTSWDLGIDRCVNNPDSEGFNGTYSDDWKPGCILRRCCGADCCNEGTTYDGEVAFCVPIGMAVPPNLKENGEICQEDVECLSKRCVQGFDGSFTCRKVGDGSVGSDCFENTDCDTLSCVFDPPSPDAPGRCSCNAETGEGCKGDFKCASPGDIGSAVGSLVSVSPFCKLPVGASCNPEKASDCLTDNCDETTGLCACNTSTSFPCNVGEICVQAVDGSFRCQEVGDPEEPLVPSTLVSVPPTLAPVTPTAPPVPSPTNTQAPPTFLAIEDFSIVQGNGFVPAYKDTSRHARAIDAKKYKDKFAAAEIIYD